MDLHVTGHAFELPGFRVLLRHALPRFVEGVIAPVAVFYAALVLLGQTGAVVVAVVWVFGGIALRAARRHPVPGTLLLAALGVSARAVLAFGTGNPKLFFLQPTLGTLLVSGVFLASVPLGRPMAQKVATDLVPLPDAFLAHDRVRRFFLRVSLLWSLVFFANAVFSLWLLWHESLETFLWLRTSVVAAAWVAAGAVSLVGFRRIVDRVGGEAAAPVAAGV
ncbi:VC0807 family protein [Actinocorallia libanotica]|uniref:Intracellular septation protein A n=1 Tax=Actinocorallia libanotica TaxID=46162 RepID=A0ABN1Q020_9ACTN